jgi:hypothetical protein
MSAISQSIQYPFNAIGHIHTNARTNFQNGKSYQERNGIFHHIQGMTGARREKHMTIAIGVFY